MGIAERVYEIVKNLPEAKAAEVLDYVETKRAKAAAIDASADRRSAALALLYKHAGRFRTVKFDRTDLHDRAGLR